MFPIFCFSIFSFSRTFLSLLPLSLAFSSLPPHFDPYIIHCSGSVSSFMASLRELVGSGALRAFAAHCWAFLESSVPVTATRVVLMDDNHQRCEQCPDMPYCVSDEDNNEWWI